METYNKLFYIIKLEIIINFREMNNLIKIYKKCNKMNIYY